MRDRFGHAFFHVIKNERCPKASDSPLENPNYSREPLNKSSADWCGNDNVSFGLWDYSAPLRTAASASAWISGKEESIGSSDLPRIFRAT